MKAGIYGAAGYAGLELIGLLNDHPAFEIAFAASDRYAGTCHEGVRFSTVDESLQISVDVVFLCTPHKASAPLAAAALENDAKVVDLSADLRLKTVDAYQRWYGVEHPHPELLPTVYGLPEFQRAAICHQDRVANPGCYPTTTLLGLLPLAQARAIRPQAQIIVDAKSGVSGAGRSPKVDTLFSEIFGDFKPYNIGRMHRHVGEIEQELQAVFPSAGALIFSPHLIPIDRGLLATCYVPLADGWDYAQARQVMETQYASEALVKVLPADETARIKQIAGRDGAVISLHAATDDTLIVVAALDNLRKGAASQAVQNANLMFDIPEMTGLKVM